MISPRRTGSRRKAFQAITDPLKGRIHAHRPGKPYADHAHAEGTRTYPLHHRYRETPAPASPRYKTQPLLKPSRHETVLGAATIGAELVEIGPVRAVPGLHSVLKGSPGHLTGRAERE